MKNLYEVVVSTKRHYGNGHMERTNSNPLKIVALSGDEAVTKAKKKLEIFEPVLETVKVLEYGVE